jgi:aryl-alcohol dehydrogenase-like predicted oxidoreductase/predicted kinase
MRIALGCMRLSTERDRDDDRAQATLRAAIEAGIAVFDTAHAYGIDQSDVGHNERLVGRALRSERDANLRVITKCGMRRDAGAWIPDGRASRISEDVLGSMAALDGIAIDTLLLHAPDPRTSLTTTGRALAKQLEKGHAKRIGVSNVSRKQLEELARHVPIAAVEVALGAYDDLALRSGVVSYCQERGIELLAHAPLGGPQRAARLARDGVLGRVAKGHASATAIEVFLAYLLAVSKAFVPVVGARRPETIASLVAASQTMLSDDDLATIDARFPVLAAWRARSAARSATATATATRDEGRASKEVVVFIGVPGAGKSRAAEGLVARGYERLNRDSLGGTLRGIVRRLDERLRDGATHVVLDNTYVTRATRNDVIRIAHGHGAEVRCVFFDTPPHEAQINVVRRMIARFGSVLGPAELAQRSREDPSALAPSAIYRMTRELEPPAADEGFAAIDVVPFVREHAPQPGRPGAAISLDAPEDAIAAAVAGTPPDAACLLFAWRPALDDATRDRAQASADALARATGRIVDIAFCTHPAGPPICWCRPPLPGLWLAFAHRHGVDARASTLCSSSNADHTFARALGLRLT